jgi:hypothetical protein
MRPALFSRVGFKTGKGNDLDLRKCEIAEMLIMPFLATVVHGMNATNYCRCPAECQLIIALPDACPFY